MSGLNVLLAHSRYLQPGGEEAVFEAEAGILRARGNTVTELVEDNRRIASMNGLRLAARTVWSVSSRKSIDAIIAAAHPEVAHFHNTFPLLSPSVYSVCRARGVPVIQTLHNYRLLCPNALFFRDGHICEDCLGRAVPWPGVAHACYRGSRPETAVVATMLAVHRLLRTWQTQVNVFIALSEFARGKFVEGGLPGERIVVKPNFVHPDPGRAEGERDLGPLFVGRLSVEKGARLMLEAWHILGDIPLEVAGDGPLLGEAREVAHAGGMQNVVFLGRLGHDQALGLMKRATFLVVPSECYENFPLVVAEAFACGLPVVASNHGTLAEIVEDGRTGLLFAPGSAASLAAKVEWAWRHPAEMADLGHEARREYEAKYTEAINYRCLMRIYESALRDARA